MSVSEPSSSLRLRPLSDKTAGITDIRFRRPNRTLRSVRAYIGGLDYLAPLFSFVSDQFSKVCGRARNHATTQFSQSRLETRIGERRIDLSVKPVDDIGRGVAWRAQAAPD